MNLDVGADYYVRRPARKLFDLVCLAGGRHRAGSGAGRGKKVLEAGPNPHHPSPAPTMKERRRSVRPGRRLTLHCG